MVQPTVSNRTQILKIVMFFWHQKGPLLFCLLQGEMVAIRHFRASHVKIVRLRIFPCRDWQGDVGWYRRVGTIVFWVTEEGIYESENICVTKRKSLYFADMFDTQVLPNVKSH